VRRIGIIGGGQLGRMAIEESRKYLAHIEVLTPEYPSPAAELADAALVGELMDYESVLDLAEGVDVVSYEIEGVNVDALRELERRGKQVIPSAAVLWIVQDKARQKGLLDSAGIPTAPWVALESTEGEAPAPAALEAAAYSLGGFPLVQKSRMGGYDGRGVRILSSPTDEALPGPSLAEKRVDLAKELAVVVARSPDGFAAVYPCVEMLFDERANLCDSVLAPARIDASTRARAEELALACVRALDAETGRGICGVFAVELFLAKDGRILVNEIAPRPHNSGHFSIEACSTSQFDQYLRVLLGLPLGSPELLRPAMMINLFGGPGQSGKAEYIGLERALAIPGVALHLYGKREVRPFRKMGHVTAIGRTWDEAMERAEAARDYIKIVAE
jgi:5-(carboxyamino)imidazole ribonucleotide synthase